MRSVAELISEMLRRACFSMICPQAFRRNRRSSECEPPDPEPPAGDPSGPVPTCPDWTLKQLFRHIGRGNRRRRRSSPTRNGKPPEDPDAAIDCRNRPPTRYQGAAEIVASPDLAWQGVHRCKFVTWIFRAALLEQTRAFGAHRGVSPVRTPLAPDPAGGPQDRRQRTQRVQLKETSDGRSKRARHRA